MYLKLSLVHHQSVPMAPLTMLSLIAVSTEDLEDTAARMEPQTKTAVRTVVADNTVAPTDRIIQLAQLHRKSKNIKN
jgi:hypothetical protein